MSEPDMLRKKLERGSRAELDEVLNSQKHDYDKPGLGYIKLGMCTSWTSSKSPTPKYKIVNVPPVDSSEKKTN